METIDIRGSNGISRIHINERLQNLAKHLPSDNVVVISDQTVSALYGAQFPTAPVILMDPGEENKTLETVMGVFQKLLDLDAQRSTFIVGIGGGIVCDVAGFAASTFLRGLRFGFVSTTLLSQVDASVGGKNGVNFKGYKNMVGVFNQPDFVICDLNLLSTLPQRERLCGFAEIVKHAAIADKALFHFLEGNCDRALSLDLSVIEKLVSRSVEIKSSVVVQDETEKGERRKLNFGHTFGHAIEKTLGLPHGEAVSLGMVMAAALSVKKGLMPRDHADKLSRLLDNLGLPTKTAFNKKQVLAALKKDKKRQGDRIHFVLLTRIGESVIADIPIQELDDWIDGL